MRICLLIVLLFAQMMMTCMDTMETTSAVSLAYIVGHSTCSIWYWSTIAPSDLYSLIKFVGAVFTKNIQNSGLHFYNKARWINLAQEVCYSYDCDLHLLQQIACPKPFLFDPTALANTPAMSAERSSNIQVLVLLFHFTKFFRLGSPSDKSLE